MFRKSLAVLLAVLLAGCWLAPAPACSIPPPPEDVELTPRLIFRNGELHAFHPQTLHFSDYPFPFSDSGFKYRFYEMVQVYGTTLKALVHEQSGDGIISAINFKLDIKKVDDPEGGSRAVITLDGKFLPYQPF